MEQVLRAFAMYVFLLIVFRFAGKRTMAEMTNFDLVLLLIISETTQQAMVDDDHSFTAGAILVLTLVGTSVLLSELKIWFPSLEKLLESSPLIIVDNGRLLRDRMRKLRIGEADILASARAAHGLERMDDVKYAIVETSGEISIVPWAR